MGQGSRVPHRATLAPGLADYQLGPVSSGIVR